eukprot:2813412-Amphidinium_carterae.1
MYCTSPTGPGAAFGVVTIGMDCSYLLEGAEVEGSMPLWCAKDTRRWFYGAVMPTKGIEHP